MPNNPEPDIIEREKPAEWAQLALGGRFMDRILPAPIYRQLTTDTWGADGVRPRDIENGIEHPDWSYWGGKPVVGPDGRYHFFCCRWSEKHPKGHGGWLNSVIVRAISDRPTGPFVFENEIGPGHFPEITRLADGSWIVFELRGYYESASLDGPWRYVSHQLGGYGDTQMGSVVVREDGSLLMVDRVSRIWIKENGSDRYVRTSEQRHLPTHMPGYYEDPFIWRSEVQYHMLINDWLGRIAYHMRSPNGLHWITDPGVAYTVGIDRYEDGTSVDWYKYERPKVLQDAFGRATHLYLAVIDVPKDQDKCNDNHSSKNIAHPLVVERRMWVLNTEKITPDTREVRVKVASEKDYRPDDFDIDSLRFGSSHEVDFGRGGTATRTQRDGEDLILTFTGGGHGINESEFAGKLLGKTHAGKLVIGYARLPGYQSGPLHY
ncbi:MAG: hypothetical protein GC164_04945 [Phycisphaera sp.]|nr:hypothetical protein [Phycisphaera sp.]